MCLQAKRGGLRGDISGKSLEVHLASAILNTHDICVNNRSPRPERLELFSPICSVLNLKSPIIDTLQPIPSAITNTKNPIESS